MTHQINIFLLLFGALQGGLLSLWFLKNQQRKIANTYFALFLIVIGLQLTFKVITKSWPFAAKTKTSRHHVSQVLNERIKKTYVDFICELRLQETRRRLSDPSQSRMTPSKSRCQTVRTVRHLDNRIKSCFWWLWKR